MSSPLGSRAPSQHIAALVGLCPLLALAPDAAQALTLAVAIVLMTLLALPWWALSQRAAPAIFWSTRVLGLAAAAGATQLLLEAFSHGVHPLTALGVPLIAANLALWGCGIPAELDRDSVATKAFFLLQRALGLALALFLLGVLRELFAQGSVFAMAGTLFGADFPDVTLRIAQTHHGLLLFAHPAGALFALACLIAALQAWRSRSPSTTGHA